MDKKTLSGAFAAPTFNMDATTDSYSSKASPNYNKNKFGTLVRTGVANATGALASGVSLAAPVLPGGTVISNAIYGVSSSAAQGGPDRAGNALLANGGVNPMSGGGSSSATIIPAGSGSTGVGTTTTTSGIGGGYGVGANGDIQVDPNQTYSTSQLLALQQAILTRATQVQLQTTTTKTIYDLNKETIQKSA